MKLANLSGKTIAIMVANGLMKPLLHSTCDDEAEAKLKIVSLANKCVAWDWLGNVLSSRRKIINCVGY